MRPFQANASSYDDTVNTLSTRPSDYAPLGGRIKSRAFSASGVETYDVQIGNTLTPGISFDEILDFVSDLELERFENATFRDEEKLMREKALEARKTIKKRGRPRKASLLPTEIAESEATRTSSPTTTASTSDERTGGDLGGRGRPRPAYTQLYPKQRQHRENLADKEVAVAIGRKPAALVTTFAATQIRAGASPSRDIAGLTLSPRRSQQPKRIKLDYSSESSSTASSQARSSRARSPQVRIPASKFASPAKPQGIVKTPPKPRARKPVSPSKLDSSVHGMVAAAAYGNSPPVSAASSSAGGDSVKNVGLATNPALPPVAASDSGESLAWEIEAILAHGESDPRTHPADLGSKPVTLYQVKWEGFDEPTWEPADSFEDQSILDEYWAFVEGKQV